MWIKQFIKIYRGYELEIKARKKIKKGNTIIESNNINKKVFLLQTPTHKNLGDHAIAYAQRKFFEINYPQMEIIEIPYEKVYESINSIKKIIENEDIITIVGGGNMGDLYSYEEIMRRNIIKEFPNNNIISFPQTIDFKKSIYGKYEYKKSEKIYNNHNKLTILAREEKSFAIMKKVFKKNEVILTPDIVFYLNKCKEKKRENIVTCLRNDLEKNIGEKFEKQIINVLSKYDKKIIKTDTLTKFDISLDKREEELEKIWTIFNEAKIVVTDRLHGMIFAAITNTPCIVLKNSNHKIKYSYKNWILDKSMIILIENEEIQEVEEAIAKLLKIENRSKNDQKNSFENLKKNIEKRV